MSRSFSPEQYTTTRILRYMLWVGVRAALSVLRKHLSLPKLYPVASFRSSFFFHVPRTRVFFLAGEAWFSNPALTQTKPFNYRLLLPGAA